MQNAGFTIQLDTALLRRALRESGFSSLKDLAQAAGVHRNTVNDYLTGATRPLPEGLERILLALRVDPKEALRVTRPLRAFRGIKLTGLIDKLLPLLDGACLVLYGSRARGRFKPYSDYDLGVYRRTPIAFPQFSRMLDRVAEWNEGQKIQAQLTNLSLADKDFLEIVAKEGHFVTGSAGAWKDLLETAGVEAYE